VVREGRDRRLLSLNGRVQLLLMLLMLRVKVPVHVGGVTDEDAAGAAAGV
jgi:hypothetical protein